MRVNRRAVILAAACDVDHNSRKSHCKNIIEPVSFRRRIGGVSVAQNAQSVSWIGALELTQHLVAALNRRIQRGLRGFLVAEGLLQLVVDCVADQRK